MRTALITFQSVIAAEPIGSSSERLDGFGPAGAQTGEVLRAPLLSVVLICAADFSAVADDNRTCQISVDGKPVGQYVVKVADKDGATECQVTARVEVKALLGSYRYSLDSHEVWKDGKLTGMTSVCNDDGKKHDVSLTSDGKTATLKADGSEVKG